ncbi:MAG: GNAT family N-acetyltransferase [Deltaproteobacteria bacterium]|jgi:GNAT superfamily N-acetyltransferase|nr:GNAT family N-acetyltransferase [Deltaproteobacteria bacterium]
MPETIRYYFTRPDETPPDVLDQICDLVAKSDGVGTSWMRENLDKAFLIGYAIHEDRVVGTSTHKFPKEKYVKKIGTETGLDLSGFLERGYTAVDPAFRNRGIGLKVIQGLIERSKGKKIYVTIDTNNPWPLRMAQRVGMVLAGRFINDRTGHELGVFTNVTPPLNSQNEIIP